MKVMFGVPAYRGIKCLPFLDSLEETVQLFLDSGVECQFTMVSQDPYIQAVRNRIARDFLESDCDKLFFLDDDLSWKAEDALRLLQTGKDCVAGIYPMKSDKEQFPCVLDCTEEGYPLVDGDLLKASRLPTGFLLVDRSAFEAVRAANPRLEYDDYPDEAGDPVRDGFDYFPQGVYNRRWMGEDYAFCSLWEQTGGKMHILPDIEFGHHGVDENGDPKVWEGSLLDYLQRLPGGCREKEGLRNGR